MKKKYIIYIFKKWPYFKNSLNDSKIVKNLPNKLIYYQKALNNTNNKEKMNLDRYMNLGQKIKKNEK